MRWLWILALAVPLQAQITLQAHTAAACVSSCTGAGPVTTTGINTVGATLEVVIAYAYQGTVSVSSTPSNTWHEVNSAAYGTNPTIAMYYAYAPATNSSQTFTCTGSSQFYGGCLAMSFTGTLTTSAVIDNFTGSTSASGACTATALTPTSSGEMYASGVVAQVSGADTFSVGSPASIVDSIAFVNNENEPGADAYYVNSASGAITMSWTDTGTNPKACVAAFFAPAAAPSASSHASMF